MSESKNDDYITVRLKREFVEQNIDKFVESGMYRSRAHFFEEAGRELALENEENLQKRHEREARIEKEREIAQAKIDGRIHPDVPDSANNPRIALRKEQVALRIKRKREKMLDAGCDYAIENGVKMPTAKQSRPNLQKEADELYHLIADYKP